MATATFKVYDKPGNYWNTLTSISYAWFDAFPSSLSEDCTDSGTTSTDAVGEIALTLTGSSLTSGQQGWCMLTHASGYEAMLPITVD